MSEEELWRRFLDSVLKSGYALRLALSGEMLPRFEDELVKFCYRYVPIQVFTNFPNNTINLRFAEPDWQFLKECTIRYGDLESSNVLDGLCSVCPEYDVIRVLYT